MRQVEASISLDEVVLRQTHLRTRSKLDYVNIKNEDKNPYIRKVMQMEQEAGGVEEITTEAAQDVVADGRGEK